MKKTIIKIMAAACFSTLGITCYAQLSTGESPVSFGLHQILWRVSAVTMPELNLATINKEDSIDNENGLPQMLPSFPADSASTRKQPANQLALQLMLIYFIRTKTIAYCGNFPVHLLACTAAGHFRRDSASTGTTLSDSAYIQAAPYSTPLVFFSAKFG